MNDVRTPESRQLPGGLTNLCHPAFVAFLSFVLVVGCHKKSASTLQVGVEPTDPEVADNLAKLTWELHQATPHHRIKTFEDFVAIAQIEVPPPPAGQKYAIGQGWKIVLVDAKAK